MFEVSIVRRVISLLTRFNLLGFILVLGWSQASLGSLESRSPQEYAIQRMKDASFSDDFIQLATTGHDQSKVQKIIELNTLGFLSKSDYSVHFSRKAIQSCTDFLQKYKEPFIQVVRAHDVAPQVISALLWVETKHGKMLGGYSVLDVYFSLLQADHSEVIEKTIQALILRSPQPTEEIISKVKERSRTKAKWALEELKFLEKLHAKRSLNVTKLKGSFAGAFGMSQFLPSSYYLWAQSAKDKSIPDLFEANDAIRSVGNYLKSNGWNSRDPQSQMKALLHYNRSDEYAKVILKIAKEVSTGTNRNLASNEGRYD